MTNYEATRRLNAYFNTLRSHLRYLPTWEAKYHQLKPVYQEWLVSCALYYFLLVDSITEPEELNEEMYCPYSDDIAELFTKLEIAGIKEGGTDVAPDFSDWGRGGGPYAGVVKQQLNAIAHQFPNDWQLQAAVGRVESAIFSVSADWSVALRPSQRPVSTVSPLLRLAHLKKTPILRILKHHNEKLSKILKFVPRAMNLTIKDLLHVTAGYCHGLAQMSGENKTLTDEIDALELSYSLIKRYLSRGYISLNDPARLWGSYEGIIRCARYLHDMSVPFIANDDYPSFEKRGDHAIIDKHVSNIRMRAHELHNRKDQAAQHRYQVYVDILEDIDTQPRTSPSILL